MAEVKKLDLDDEADILGEEDEETLACNDEGIRDADAGRTVPIADVRKLLPQVDYQLLFTQRALRDLSGIIGYITEDDAESASCFWQRLARPRGSAGPLPAYGRHRPHTVAGS